MPTITSVEQALKKIPRGKRIFVGSNAAIPTALVQGLVDHRAHFQDNEILHLLLLSGPVFVGKEFSQFYRDNTMFIGPTVRKGVQEGDADYTPIFLSEIPRLIRSNSFEIAAALIAVTPPDKHGMCNLGVSVDVERTVLDKAAIKIAQINRKMPRTFGNTFVPYKMFDYVVEADTPLPEIPPAAPDEIVEAIGQNVASLIKDGAVLQLGIGAIPNAILKNLIDRNDLGVHSEMFSDGIIPLVKNGNVNNRLKNTLPGKSAVSFCFGTQALYDYVNENPLIEFHTTDFVNDPFVIAQNDNMVAVNSALQIDLTGQVCADSIGHKFYSGFGGQVDFIRGASRSKGGKPIIALSSTAKDGEISRIVGQLSPGAGVVTSRGDVRYVVTEYGVAYLHGKSIRQRAVELIQIAHPKFRDELLDFVKNNKYVYFDQTVLLDETRYPDDEEEIREFEGKELRIRAIKVTDERKLQDLAYSLDPKCLFERFKYLPVSFTRETAKQFVCVDYQKSMAFAVFEEGDHDSRMVAFGHFSSEKGQNSGEASMDIVVLDNYRGHGIGLYLGGKLLKYAKKQGIQSLKVRMEASNTGGHRMMLKLGEQVQRWQSKTEGTLTTFVFYI